MAKLVDKFRKSEFHYLFNSKDELAAGRQAMYIYNIVITITNALITGVMYTAFLTECGVNMVEVTIIAFVPYIAWFFSLFTPMIYARVKRRRALLIFNTTFYYTCVVLATTLMPRFVADPAQRTVWLAVLLLTGNISNALFGSGSTAWHIHYIPDERSRTGYVGHTNIAVTLTSTVVSLTAVLLADSLRGSPMSGPVIDAMRYGAFVLAILSTLFLWLRPRSEYYYHSFGREVKFLDLFKVPLSNKAFLNTSIIFFLYSFTANVNADSWSFYVLNTLEYSMISMYSIHFVYSLAYLFMLKYWRGAVSRQGYYKIYLLSIVVSVILEIPMALTRPDTVWIYVATSTLQGINLVGTSYINSNLFYINLPEGQTDSCIVFWNLGSNICILLGRFAGSRFIRLTELTGPYTLNLDFLFLRFRDYPLYGSQLLVCIKAALYLLLCGYIIYALRAGKGAKRRGRGISGPRVLRQALRTK